jgi:hypothetical protein
VLLGFRCLNLLLTKELTCRELLSSICEKFDPTETIRPGNSRRNYDRGTPAF